MLIGIVGDLEKAFLNVGLQTQDRDVTRFIWLKDSSKPDLESNIQVYRFCRVPFGVIPSPFLLGATITHHLQQSDNPFAERIKRDIYVDNVITGVNTLEEAKVLYTETKSLFLTASMNMREWASNSKEFMEFLPQQDKADKPENTEVLGINWNLISDELSVPSPSDSIFEHASTKREVLKVIASVFDPLGYFSPTILDAKLFMKELWVKEYQWDSRLDDKLLNITIPRLELLGVLIGVRALKFVLREFPVQVTHKFVLTDSLCVLHWLFQKNNYRYLLPTD